MSKVLKSLKGSRTSGFELRAPRVKGFKACRDISLVYPQGVKGVRESISPKLTGFQGINVSSVPKIQGPQGFKG